MAHNVKKRVLPFSGLLIWGDETNTRSHGLDLWSGMAYHTLRKGIPATWQEDVYMKDMWYIEWICICITGQYTGDMSQYTLTPYHNMHRNTFHIRFQEFVACSYYRRPGWIIASHTILWDATTYHCLRFASDTNVLIYIYIFFFTLPSIFTKLTNPTFCKQYTSFIIGKTKDRVCGKWKKRVLEST